MSVGHINNLISQLKAIFKETGQGDIWNVNTNSGNPACSTEVSDFSRAISEEQAEAHVSQKQASPMTLQKLTRLGTFLDREINSQDNSRREKFLFL